MDRVRTKSKASRVRYGALIAAAVVAVVSGGVTLANIDFQTQRVDRTTLTTDTVQRGLMEVKVGANGRLVSTHVEQLAARVPGRVARADIKPGAVVSVGDVLVVLANPQLTAAAEEAQSAWEGAVAELQAAGAELQTNMLNQEVALTQVQFNAEKAAAKTEADEALARNGLISGEPRLDECAADHGPPRSVAPRGKHDRHGHARPALRGTRGAAGVAVRRPDRGRPAPARRGVMP